jgi:hypothetical protein
MYEGDQSIVEKKVNKMTKMNEIRAKKLIADTLESAKDNYTKNKDLIKQKAQKLIKESETRVQKQTENMNVERKKKINKKKKDN